MPKPKPKTDKLSRKFAELLRQLRAERGLTQEDLGDLLNVDRAYISQLERGLVSPSLRAMVKLAKVLSVQLTFAEIDFV